MSPFVIQSCTLADAYTVGSNNVKSFWTDITWRQTWAGHTVDEVAHNGGLRGGSNFLKNRAHRRHLKAVDAETGEIVGYARWVLPHAGCTGDDDDPCHKLWPEARMPDVSEEERKEAEERAEKAEWESLMDGNTMPGIDGPIQDMLANLKRPQDTYMELDYLCVPAEWRNKGVGSMLARRGLEEAEKLGFDSSVLGMRAALGIYQKVGYVVVDHVLVDASYGGGEKDYGGWFLEKCLEKS